MNKLADLLARPEGRTLDFKREEVALQKALKTIVSFANTSGGTLVLGVADDGSLPGVSDVKLQEERYANAIASGITPALVVDHRPVEHEGADLLLVRVPRFPGPFALTSEVETEHEGIYVRLGSTSRPATPEQRDELRREATAQAWDERPCNGATLDDLDTGAAEAAFEAVGRRVDAAALESLKLVVRHGDQKVPSNGGIVLFGTVDARQRLVPGARFRCARFLGTTKDEILDRLDVADTVLAALGPPEDTVGPGHLGEVRAFIRRNTRMAARIEGEMRRQNIPEYPARALREVLANAVAHADYSQRTMPLRVQIYDDRLEVENPGGWPLGFDEEDFKNGVSKIRNPVIARVLHELDFIEGWGSGYERIQSTCEKGGYPMPVWEEAGPVLRVRFRPHPEVAVNPMQIVLPLRKGEVAGREYSDTEGVGVNVGVPAEDVGVRPPSLRLNERQAWFVEQIGKGARITAEDLAAHFDVADRTAERDIRKLRDAEVIAFVGAPKTGRYIPLQHRSLDTPDDA